LAFPGLRVGHMHVHTMCFPGVLRTISHRRTQFEQRLQSPHGQWVKANPHRDHNDPENESTRFGIAWQRIAQFRSKNPGWFQEICFDPSTRIRERQKYRFLFRERSTKSINLKLMLFRLCTTSNLPLIQFGRYFLKTVHGFYMGG